MYIYDICNYIADNTSLVLNTSLFVGEMKAGVNGVYAVQGASQEPDRYTDTKYFVIEFWAKNNKTEKAYSDLAEIYNLLHQAHAFDVATYHVYYANALGQVMDMDRDFEENKILKLTCSFIVQ